MSQGLLGSERPLQEQYATALFDLDGVCFAGDCDIPHAADGVNGARAAGMTLTFVTNNASRAPHSVVTKLAQHGIEGRDGEVFSAAMDAVALLAEHIPAPAPVLVIGGEGVRAALEEAGYQPVDSAEAQPVAVVQGFAPQVDWAMLTEGVYAINNGALHVATNMDATLPTERGFAIGNGSLVAAVVNATGKQPLAAGKPHPGIYERALKRSGGTAPIAIGDRLDTDLVGARGADIPGLHVLTGVSDARAVLQAKPQERPSFLHTDLRGLAEPHPVPLFENESWRVGSWQASLDGQTALLTDGTASSRIPLDAELAASESAIGPVELSLDAYRALASLLWWASDEKCLSELSLPQVTVRA